MIAVGFRPKKFFIFSDSDCVGGVFYRNISRISRQITITQAKSTLGSRIREPFDSCDPYGSDDLG